MLDLDQTSAAPSRVSLLTPERRPAGSAAAPDLRPTHRLEGAEATALVAQVIEEMRPRLQRDGGDCELVDIVDDVVRVRMKGACASCQLVSMTLSGVRMQLSERLGFRVKVVPV